MARYEGANADIGAGVETTYGTPVSITNWVETNNYALTVNVQKRMFRTLRQNSRFGRTAPVTLLHEVGLTMDLDMSYDFQGWIWRAALGTSSSAGGGPYNHTYDAAYPLPSYTIAADLGGSGNSRTVNGCVVNTLTARWTPEDLAQLSVEWIGRQAAAPASEGSPTYGAVIPVKGLSEVALVWNSLTFTTELKSVSLTINNNLQRSYNAGSVYTAIPFSQGERVTELQVEVEYGSVLANALATAAEGVTSSDAVLTVTNATQTIVVTLYNAQIHGNSVPAVSGPDQLVYTITLRGQGDDTDPAIDVVITNASASAVANA